jgi:hypothetical protein
MQHQSSKTKKIAYSLSADMMKELVHLLRRNLKEMALKFKQDAVLSVFLIRRLQ